MRFSPIFLPVLFCLFIMVGLQCSKTTESQNKPPGIPAIEDFPNTPPDNSINQSITPVLRWTCSDPDGDGMAFSIFFDTTNNPRLKIGSQYEIYYFPDTLSYGTIYYWKVVARDMHNDSTSSPVWSFTTMDKPDTSGPTVISEYPADGAANVPVNVVINARFSEPIKQSTVSETTFILDHEMTGTVSYSDSVATYTPDSALLQNTTYSVMLTADIEDLFGNQLYPAYTWTFTTESSPYITWERILGGPDKDGANSITVIPNGYVFTGYTYSYSTGYQDVYLAEIDSMGVLVWENIIGGGGSDYAYKVAPTADGGYILSGVTYSYGAGGLDIYLIKTDQSGVVSWEETYGAAGFERGWDVLPISDKEYFIAGETAAEGSDSADVYILWANHDDNLLYEKTYGGPGDDAAWACVATPDDGFIVVGRTNSFGAGGYDAYYMKINSLKDTAWTRTYGGAGYEDAVSIIATYDGNYVFTGETDGDVLVVFIDGDGNVLNSSVISNDGSEWGWSIDTTSDGGYIIAGVSNSFGGGDWDVYLVKIDNTGDLQWEKTFGGAEKDMGNDVNLADDGGFIIAGSTESIATGIRDYYFIKTDPDGNVVQYQSPVSKIPQSKSGSFRLPGLSSRKIIEEFKGEFEKLR